MAIRVSPELPISGSFVRYNDTCEIIQRELQTENPDLDKIAKLIEQVDTSVFNLLHSARQKELSIFLSSEERDSILTSILEYYYKDQAANDLLTKLHLAILAENDEYARKLIFLFGGPQKLLEEVTTKGTALSLAASLGRTSIVQSLADYLARSVGLITRVWWAAEIFDRSMTGEFATDWISQPLYQATAIGHFPLVWLFTRRYVTPQWENARYPTPLIFTAISSDNLATFLYFAIRNPETIDQPLESGSDVTPISTLVPEKFNRLCQYCGLAVHADVGRQEALPPELVRQAETELKEKITTATKEELTSLINRVNASEERLRNHSVEKLYSTISALLD